MREIIGKWWPQQPEVTIDDSQDWACGSCLKTTSNHFKSKQSSDKFPYKLEVNYWRHLLRKLSCCSSQSLNRFISLPTYRNLTVVRGVLKSRQFLHNTCIRQARTLSNAASSKPKKRAFFDLKEILQFFPPFCLCVMLRFYYVIMMSIAVVVLLAGTDCGVYSIRKILFLRLFYETREPQQKLIRILLKLGIIV